MSEPPGNEQLAPSPPRRLWLWVGMIGTLLVMITAFSLFVFSLMETIEKRNIQLRIVLDTVQAQSARLTAAAAESKNTRTALEIFLGRRATTTLLTGTSITPSAQGLLLQHPESGRLLLIVAGLHPNARRRYILRIDGVGGAGLIGSIVVADTLATAFLFDYKHRAGDRISVTSEDGAIVYLIGRTTH